MKLPELNKNYQEPGGWVILVPRRYFIKKEFLLPFDNRNVMQLNSKT